jgi:large subunit ribosomal protein L49
VTRSRTRNLPVYTDYANGRTRVLTIVRRVTGDADAAAAEVSRVLGGAQVEVFPGRLQVAGNRAEQLRGWLAGLGF